MPIVGNPAAINNLPASYQGVFADYVAGGTITKGHVLVFTTTGTVTESGATANLGTLAGVATENAVSGEAVNVLVHGVGLVSCVAAAIAAGAYISSSTSAGLAGPSGVTATGGVMQGTLGYCFAGNGSAAGDYLCHVNVVGIRTIA